MRHRLFRAVVVMGAAVGCSQSDSSSNPPAPTDSATSADTATATDTTTPVDTAVAATDTAVADSALSDSAKPATDTADTCVDEGCGCFPCIK